jgi:outer membrane receptor protein involved in Fe transport
MGIRGRSFWLVGLLCLGQHTALAQDEPLEQEQIEDEEPVVEEVVVTGSRLIHSNLDSPSPVLVIEGSDLIDIGITTLGEFSRYLPQNALVVNGEQFNSSVRGSASFNLRGIGTDATLTLLNGRRVAPYGAQADSSPYVDINAIPVAAIERIEVLKDGASAIYGSEAVAGVVNIITKRDFKGLTIAGGFLTTTEGDGEEWDISLWGGWSNEATRLAVTLSYFDRAIVWGRDREFSRDADLRPRHGRNVRSPWSSPPSVFLLDSEVIDRDPTCPEQTDFNSHQISPPFCLFNHPFFHSLQQPTERLSLSGTIDHVFDGGNTGFLELLASSRDTSSWLAPTPVFPLPFVPDYHPQNPFGENLLLFYRLMDTPSRESTTTSDGWRILAGMKGQLAREWTWEAALSWSGSDTESTLATAILREEFQAALLGFGGPNGDQFYNPFGLNPQNPMEVLEEFLVYGVSEREASREANATLHFTGTLLEMAAGPLEVAMGGEARRQSLDQTADELALRGVLVGSLGFAPLNVDRDIYAAFIEMFLPWHESFETQLALRYDHYSDFGGTLNPKIGLGWRPTPDLLLRATWGTSFRPPTFRELFDPPLQFVDLSDPDPHRCPVTGSNSDCFGHPVVFEFSGNPNLEPDEGENWNLGFAWEPDQLPGLSVSLDWWMIEHKNRITQSGDHLTEPLSPEDNPFVIRAPPSPEDIALGIPGPIVKYADTYFNGDTLETRGIDFGLSYSWTTQRAGAWQAEINYTYLEKYELGLDFETVQIVEDFAGEQLGFEGGLPQDRATLRLNWEGGRNGVTALVRYVGDYLSPVERHDDGIPTGEIFVIDSFTQLDLTWRYRFERLPGSQLQLGCNNCTDEYPFYNFMFGFEPFHEYRGAMFYVRWQQDFGGE